MIVMTEYEKLASNQSVVGKDGFQYIKKEIFHQLEVFIETEDMSDFLTIHTRRGIGKVIQAKNYVGVLQV